MARGMTDREHELLNQSLKDAAKRASRDPEFARRILMQTGMYDQNGHLKPGVKYNCGLINCEPCPDYKTTRCPEYQIKS